MSDLLRMHFPTEDIKIQAAMRREDILKEIEQASHDVVPQKVLDVYGKVVMPHRRTDLIPLLQLSYLLMAKLLFQTTLKDR